ncbi:phospholipid scramblase 2-like [Orbicella faveolata]|uniref:phospholipid scramblase 2-like n=1 Tax=Orbicella faveolata TaxID=48498 RepID=UPI0009E4E31D|nr:phospholipid scramblase 2-like [Orbicella faveolata]
MAYQQPLQQQPGVPGQVQWMAAPQAPMGCPPGLEYLTAIDQLLVQQQVELLEAFTGFETNNKYKICNAMGQQVYFAAEGNAASNRYQQQRNLFKYLWIHTM